MTTKDVYALAWLGQETGHSRAHTRPATAQCAILEVLILQNNVQPARLVK
jgi:hypothetical protein